MTEIEDLKPHREDSWLTTICLAAGVLALPALLLWGLGTTYLW